MGEQSVKDMVANDLREKITTMTQVYGMTEFLTRLIETVEPFTKEHDYVKQLQDDLTTALHNYGGRNYE